MKYTYAYKTSDGVRHEATLEAASREAAFAALRAQGIRAIKVVAADGSKDNGEVIVRGVRKRVVTALAILVALLAGAVSFWLGRGRPAVGPQPTLSPAQPLPRQMISGDRQRVERAKASLANAAERALAAFAEPGRPLPEGSLPEASDSDYRAALGRPLLVASDELTESIDLKRIVTGLKDELRTYLAECTKRQEQEVACRARAEKRLAQLLDEPSAPSPSAPAQRDLSRAYGYWLKANAQLHAMGIHPIPTPAALREYQRTLDIEE